MPFEERCKGVGVLWVFGRDKKLLPGRGTVSAKAPRWECT